MKYALDLKHDAKGRAFVKALLRLTDHYIAGGGRTAQALGEAIAILRTSANGIEEYSGVTVTMANSGRTPDAGCRTSYYGGIHAGEHRVRSRRD